MIIDYELALIREFSRTLFLRNNLYIRLQANCRRAHINWLRTSPVRSVTISGGQFLVSNLAAIYFLLNKFAWWYWRFGAGRCLSSDVWFEPCLLSMSIVLSYHIMCQTCLTKLQFFQVFFSFRTYIVVVVMIMHNTPFILMFWLLIK